MWINGKTTKTPDFYDNPYLHLSQSVFINRNSIFPEGIKWKGNTHQVWCLKYSICTDSSDEQSAFDEL